MKPQDGRSHFDRRAPRYDRSIHQKLMFGPVHETVLSAFGAFAAVPRDVLDVGCGTGRLLESAGRLWPGAKLVGVDASERMIAEARRKHDGDARFMFEQRDASDLRLEDASFDVAFSTMSFHHWGDKAAGIREVARVLRPGGLFLLADVAPPLLFMLRPLLNRGERADFRRPAAVRRLFEQGGLSVVMERRFWRLVRVRLFVTRKDHE
ncbi:MAG TPA: class I SAM-dependent methyltransferase [Terriglobales bacterium]|nr:class I SAM-dependent methyltransferase [Terriglobales bacterium]